MTHLLKAARQDVLQEPTKELLGADLHRFVDARTAPASSVLLNESQTERIALGSIQAPGRQGRNGRALCEPKSFLFESDASSTLLIGTL